MGPEVTALLLGRFREDSKLEMAQLVLDPAGGPDQVRFCSYAPSSGADFDCTDVEPVTGAPQTLVLLNGDAETPDTVLVVADGSWQEVGPGAPIVFGSYGASADKPAIKVKNKRGVVIENASHIVFSDIAIESDRARAIQITDAHHITIDGAVIRGSYGVVVRVNNSDIVVQNSRLEPLYPEGWETNPRIAAHSVGE